MNVVATKENEGFQDRVVAINRVAKVVKGGRRFSFSALVVAGDGQGRVGFGVGKAGEVPDAIKKASDQAKKNLLSVLTAEGTLPYDVEGRFGSTLVKMFPAKAGTGIIAGGAARIILELGGVKDIVCKIHGSKNGFNVVRATVDGLQRLMSVEEYSKMRDVSPENLQQKRVHAKK